MDIYTAIDMTASDLAIAKESLALMADEIAIAVVEQKGCRELASEYIRLQGQIDGMEKINSYLLQIDTGVNEGDFVRHVADMVEEFLEDIRMIADEDNNLTKETIEDDSDK